MTLDIILNYIYIIMQIYGAILIINIILSWFPSSHDYKIPRFIRVVASWYLGIFEGKASFGGLDLSVIIGMIIYYNVIGLFIGQSFFGF